MPLRTPSPRLRCIKVLSIGAAFIYNIITQGCSLDFSNHFASH